MPFHNIPKPCQDLFDCKPSLSHCRKLLLLRIDCQKCEVLFEAQYFDCSRPVCICRYCYILTPMLRGTLHLLWYLWCLIVETYSKPLPDSATQDHFSLYSNTGSRYWLKPSLAVPDSYQVDLSCLVKFLPPISCLEM